MTITTRPFHHFRVTAFRRSVLLPSPKNSPDQRLENHLHGPHECPQDLRGGVVGQPQTVESWWTMERKANVMHRQASLCPARAWARRAGGAKRAMGTTTDAALATNPPMRSFMRDLP